MNNKKIVVPEFGFENPLTGLIVELERVREKFDHGTTPKRVFFELRDIFQLATSMTSARIEGNHTTVIDVVDALSERVDKGTKIPDAVMEVTNIQDGIKFIEENIHTCSIDKAFICELHRIVVKDLVREGDERPGAYRLKPVTINKSPHKPPAPSDVKDYMDELVKFINQSHGPQFDLLKDALAHHKFTWIHPFTNGNGRVARLLTYAMMAKQGFIDSSGIRALNPTAVFGSNREQYYDHLSRADSLKAKDILVWSSYMLTGVKSELEKVAKLQDINYVKNEILLPALKRGLDRKHITPQEYDMLRIAVSKDTLRSSDFQPVIRGTLATRARAIQALRENRLLRQVPGSARIYQIRLSDNIITTDVMRVLDDNGLLPPLNVE
jgi:Fic family protein